jgi:hypothetical protein
MGTRADFYVGRGATAEWIGSITWDGYPAGIDETVFGPQNVEDYRQAVAGFLASRNDATLPNEPWPWPWENSQTTDYAYAWDDGRVYGSSFGDPWFEVDLTVVNGGEPEDEEPPAEKVPFPDMSGRKGDLNHIMSRSGLITVSFPKGGTQ